MKIVVLGLTITSSWGNGHATTYRSLLAALARRGHSISFIEKDVEWYRSNRDLPNPDFCRVRLYDEWQSASAGILAASLDADVIVIGSYYPDAILASRAFFEKARCPILFYDIDTPITLSALRTLGGNQYLESSLIPGFDAYLSFTGGPALQELESRFHARHPLPFYCSVDPDLYRPTTICSDFACDLSYLGTYASDRQASLKRLLVDAAHLLTNYTFMVAGPQYPDSIAWRENIVRINHLSPPDHPSFYSSSRFTLNLTRGDMIATGYSPSVRLFEASACGATIVSDNWPGLGDFLTPGQEILLPADAHEVVAILTTLPDAERTRIGQRARERILSEHSSAHRAAQFEQIVSDCTGKAARLTV